MDTEKNQEETELTAAIGDDLAAVLAISEDTTLPEPKAANTEDLAAEYTGTEATGDDLQDLLLYAPETPAIPTVELSGFSMTEAEANNLRAQLVIASSSGFVDVKVKKLAHYAGPEQMRPATIGSVGVDLYSANSQPILLNNMGARAVIPTGIILELPVGFEAQIRSRSGLASKNGIVVTNSPGTVDSDYRGEIMVILTNTSNNRFTVERGMRIAQMVINQVPLVRFVEVDEVSETERGAGGFGSTGL
jgi:dUTP pyrophosphatase